MDYPNSLTSTNVPHTFDAEWFPAFSIKLAKSNNDNAPGYEREPVVSLTKGILVGVLFSIPLWLVIIWAAQTLWE